MRTEQEWKDIEKRIEKFTKKDLEKLQNDLRDQHQHLIYLQSQKKGEYLDRIKWYEQLQQKIEDQINLEYKRLAKEKAPKKPIWHNTWRAFLVGGMICTFGQIVIELCQMYFSMEAKEAAGIASATIVVMTAILTGLGIYDEIGRFGGAGSMVPITGFANSIASAALEFKREGLIYGIGAKIFTIAGPVILYGTLVSVMIGLISYLGGVK